MRQRLPRSASATYAPVHSVLHTGRGAFTPATARTLERSRRLPTRSPNLWTADRRVCRRVRLVVLPRWCGGVLVVGRRGGRGGAESAGNPSLAISYSGIPWGVQRTPRDTRGDTAGGGASANIIPPYP